MSMPARFPAAVVTAYNKVEIADIPAYPLGPYDATVRILACSVCAATDTHLIDGSFPRAWCSPPPFVIGHESVGRVTAIGPKVRHFQVGQMVVRTGWAPANFAHGGFGSAWGGFSTWGMVRDARAIPAAERSGFDSWWLDSLPVPEMPARDATMFTTWRDTRSCLQQMAVTAGQRVVVFGSGGNGLAFLRFATVLGARVVLVGSPSRFDRGTRLGAVACVNYRDGDKVPAAVKDAFGGEAADVVIEAAGTSQHIAQCLGCLARGGKLFLFGIPPELQYPCNLYSPPGQFTVLGKACAEWQAHGQVLTHYLSGEIKVDDFCDATLPLEQINAALAAIRRKEAIKICLTMPT